MNNIVTLKCRLDVTQGHWKWYYGRICSRLWNIKSRVVWPWKQG